MTFFFYNLQLLQTKFNLKNWFQNDIRVQKDCFVKTAIAVTPHSELLFGDYRRKCLSTC